MAEWLRVGYCQGNMNSDNSALGGVTLDYGPFAFMERFAPMYNPWVGGGVPYAFGRQPQAAAVNLAGLAPSFIELVQLVGKQEGLGGAERDALVEEVRDAVQNGYVDTFHAAHDDNCRAKLGLAAWDDEAQVRATFPRRPPRRPRRPRHRAPPRAAAPRRSCLPPQALWDDLFTLMSSKAGVSATPLRGASGGGLDFTIFFRSLSADAPPAELVRGALRKAALAPLDEWPKEQLEAWDAWAERYVARMAAEARPASERRDEMNLANPKFILRNWMAVEAYEAAERGDFGAVREVHRLLCAPYDEQGGGADERWSQPTPQWARDRPGIAVMS